GYGIAQAGQEAMVSMLHAELAGTPVRVSALRPGPMRTRLRASAYVERNDPDAVDPARYARACVHLLSRAGVARRGQIWAPPPARSGTSRGYFMVALRPRRRRQFAAGRKQSHPCHTACLPC